MAGDQTHPSETVTRKPDDDVGTPGAPPAGGGKQTSQQAEITGMSSGGRDESARRSMQDGGHANGASDPVGGASQGHAEQKTAIDRDGEASAKGHYKVEKDRS